MTDGQYGTEMMAIEEWSRAPQLVDAVYEGAVIKKFENRNLTKVMPRNRTGDDNEMNENGTADA